MKKRSTALLLLVIMAMICLCADRASAQDISNRSQFGNRFSSPIQLVVTGDVDNARQRTSNWGDLDPIALRPNEQININLITTASRANLGVGLVAIDGGEIIASQDLKVASNGTVSFTYTGPTMPGMYRLLVTIASETYQIQLYVPPSSVLAHCEEP